jgi:hypothetical protein
MTAEKTIPFRVRLLPIAFFLAYLMITVFLFAFGPWPWPVVDGTKLYAFLALAHIALLLGYLGAAFRAPRDYYGRWEIKRFIQLCLIANLLFLIPTALSRVGSAVPNIAAGLTNPGAAYGMSRAMRTEKTAIIEYLRIAAGPLLFSLLPLTVYYWRRLNRTTRILSSFCILGNVAIYISMGTNKAIADLVLLAPWLVLAAHLSGISRLRLGHRVAIAGGGVIASFLFLWFFTAGQITRTGSAAVSGYFPSTQTFADPDNFLIRDLPPGAREGALSLTNYLTQGYYALYLSLDKPFVPMFGIGNSMFLHRNIARLTGRRSVEEMSYPARIEKEDGWDAYGNWSSIYPWIASDASFPGTIIIVFLIGRLFAMSWLDSLKGNNPFAVAAFAEFIIMLFYFPANNQVMQGGEELTGFCVILLLWLFTRRKYALRTPPAAGK